MNERAHEEKKQEHELVELLVEFFNEVKAWYESSPTARVAIPANAALLLHRIILRSKAL